MCIHNIFFAPSSVDGHLGDPVLAVVTNAINMAVHIHTPLLYADLVFFGSTDAGVV